MNRNIKHFSLKELEIDEAKKAGYVPFQGMLIQARIKNLEEESRLLLQDVIKCEVRFAKMDLEKGLALEEIIKGINERYSERFRKPIIDVIKKELSF